MVDKLFPDMSVEHKNALKALNPKEDTLLFFAEYIKDVFENEVDLIEQFEDIKDKYEEKLAALEHDNEQLLIELEDYRYGDKGQWA